jgi:O6-methylguanine-DNA--protein-cysteine methyltransferase
MNNIIGERQSNRNNEDVILKTIKENDVYELLFRIPAGKVSTYGDLARVVMSNGKIGGYIYGRNKKKELLEKEGISFTSDIVNDFERVRMYPQI